MPKKKARSGTPTTAQQEGSNGADREPISWRNDTRRLGDLIPWEDNPKVLTTEVADEITTSIQTFGLALPLLIDDDDNIYDGHQRQELLEGLEEYGPDAMIDVRVSSRPLTYDEKRELVIRLRENQADWDFELVGEIYEVGELRDFGFKEWKIDDFLLDKSEENYTRKVQSPIYEPTGDKPKLEELYDDSRTLQLVAEIDKAKGLTKGEKAFLRLAAQRHTVLNFQAIAEYYAHSEAEAQELMEDSALVIIDIKKAISQGFITMTEEIAKMFGEEFGTDA